MWSMIILIPETLIRIFSAPDAALIQDAVPALNMYFAALSLWTSSTSVRRYFKSLNKKVLCDLLLLLRKVFIVVPLDLLSPLTPCIWEPTAYSSPSRFPMSSAEPPAFSRC